MQIIKPVVYVDSIDRSAILQLLEKKGRVCYKSEDKITSSSASRFVSNLVAKGHLSVVEHVIIGAKFVIDRGVSHELVRHRIGSYSQESTRYCNYSGGIQFIENPYFKDPVIAAAIEQFCVQVEELYISLIATGNLTPQDARWVLPNGLKTEIEVTFNLREWRHFFTQRCRFVAHPQMKQVAIPLLHHMLVRLPEVFTGIAYDTLFSKSDYAQIIER